MGHGPKEVHKLKRHNLIGWFACVFGLSILAHAQAVPTASRPGVVQLGGGITYVQPDYSTASDKGPYFYVGYDFLSHVGLELNVHFASIVAPDDIGEDSYMVGPRFILRHKRFEPYAKAMVGVGVINLQFDNSPHSKSAHLAYGFGGGLDLRATRHINVRCFDFQAQTWSYHPHTLSPYVYSAGVAYVFR
jgi:hypothetical protein